VIIPLLIIYDLVPTERILLLPVAIIMISMLALGLSFITSILQTRARDVEHMVNIFIRISFYLTPVFYPLNMITGGRIPTQYADLYLYLNPMATYITMIRSAFTGDELGIPQHNLIFTISSTVILFWIGSIYFMRNERRAVKNL
jgi:ABC-type polysaccharide/polyol phosphate export permease